MTIVFCKQGSRTPQRLHRRTPVVPTQQEDEG